MTRYLIRCSAVLAAFTLVCDASAQQPVQRQPIHGQYGAGHSAPPSAAQASSNGQQQIPIIGAQDAINAGYAQAPKAPFGELSPQEVAFVDQVLDVWEQRTDKIKQYSCTFQRWQYDTTKHADGFYSVAAGELKYEKPDRGLFQVTKVETIASKGPPAQFRVNPRRPHGEHWICDGEWVHVLDHNEKKATRYQLGPDQRGDLIKRSPLPFLFGVKKSEVKERYWVRPLNPPNRPEELWLEVYPKTVNDAGNYSKVQVVLDRKDILPKGLVVFLPGWTPQQPNREVYQFNDRQTNNWLNAVKQKMFMQNFIQVKLGSDWEIDEEPYIPPQQAVAGQQQLQQTQGSSPQQRLATPPARQPTIR